jgi:glutathione synthase
VLCGAVEPGPRRKGRRHGEQKHHGKFRKLLQTQSRPRPCIGTPPLLHLHLQAAAIADALARPERYVVKPQREGGGNNLFGAAAAAALSPGGFAPSELAAHTLMARVFPRASPAVFVANGAAVAHEAIVSELGIYSVILTGAGGQVLLSTAAGHLLRSKSEAVAEGGVAAGFAVLDSPLLI